MDLIDKYLCEKIEEENKKVKIIGDVMGKGKTGHIIEEPSKGFFLVKVGKEKAYYHESDLKKIK